MGNNPVNYVDPTGHIRCNSIFPGLFGCISAAIGWVGAAAVRAGRWVVSRVGEGLEELGAQEAASALAEYWAEFSGNFEVKLLAQTEGSLGSLATAGTGFSESELTAAQYARQFGSVLLRQADSAAGRTSDLVLKAANGSSMTYDVYTPQSGTAVNQILSSVARKIAGQAQGVVLDLRSTSYTAADFGDIMARVQGMLNSWGLDVTVGDIKVIGGV